MGRYVRGLVDGDSLFEIHALWAREMTIGFARLAGRSSRVANNPMFKGALLFVDSADKARASMPALSMRSMCRWLFLLTSVLHGSHQRSRSRASSATAPR